MLFHKDRKKNGLLLPAASLPQAPWQLSASRVGGKALDVELLLLRARPAGPVTSSNKLRHPVPGPHLPACSPGAESCNSACVSDVAEDYMPGLYGLDRHHRAINRVKMLFFVIFVYLT